MDSELGALWRQRTLPDIVRALIARGNEGHVRSLLGEILHHGLGADYLAIDHEVRMPEVRGRADALFGATVFEIKKDLRHELADARGQLERYLAEREARLKHRFLGIATDGASFIAFELRDGALVEISRYDVRADRPGALLDWLAPAVSPLTDLLPDPLIVQRELGRDSLTFARARGTLDSLWAALKSHPEVELKRQLWDRFLHQVYAAPIGDDSLFLQHTYLTIVAKTVAASVLDLRVDDADSILSGRALTESGIRGAVESDFFDWVLQRPEGADLVLRIARQAARFRLRDAKADVLKALYESLVDPAQRHDLGEYYTPDWLAARLVRAAVDRPLEQRVLDPACGSGTFLFHTIRQLMEAAREAGWAPARIVEACEARVRGIDVHPVAVIFARVTWLLAIAQDGTIEQRASDVHVPVYLGDSMQWNVHQTHNMRDV
ncbi:MAG TPA: N-6 DNA methylase, partial [Acetobacteraceae bacterium]|nr:N-6 DNA methylase [Acetobacteraceae bacterium]